jgi:hypothetical protein
MNQNIELPSGKLINLHHLIALLPTSNTDNQYSLILQGYSQPIVLNQTEADIIKQQIKIASKHQNNNWNQEEQIHQNQPKLKRLRAWIEKDKGKQSTSETIATFEAFQKTIDAERPAGQKLYEQ